MVFKINILKVNTCNCLKVYRQGNLQIPAGIHKMVFVKSFTYNSVNIWNQINLEGRNCNRLSSFKAGYLRHHLMDLTKPVYVFKCF